MKPTTAGFPCPQCGAWTRVLSTRNGNIRRRECANSHRFFTEEKVLGLSNTASREEKNATDLALRRESS
jgi:Zn ribbon nucleic-acid-binding protein